MAIKTKGPIKNLYVNEEVTSRFTYPENYKPADLDRQVQILQKAFPHLSLGLMLSYMITVSPRPLARGAEAQFVFPLWEKIAPTYAEAVKKIYEKIFKLRPLTSALLDKLDHQHLCQTGAAFAAWKKIRKEQRGDILVVDAQFGLRHRGRSSRRVEAIIAGKEFPLGPFEGLCMLLTNPKRLQSNRDLFMDFPGARFSSTAKKPFEEVLSLNFIELISSQASSAIGHFSPLTAFTPKVQKAQKLTH